MHGSVHAAAAHLNALPVRCCALGADSEVLAEAGVEDILTPAEVTFAFSFLLRGAHMYVALGKGRAFIHAIPPAHMKIDLLHGAAMGEFCAGYCVTCQICGDVLSWNLISRRVHRAWCRSCSGEGRHKGQWCSALCHMSLVASQSPLSCPGFWPACRLQILTHAALTTSCFVAQGNSQAK